MIGRTTKETQAKEHSRFHRDEAEKRSERVSVCDYDYLLSVTLRVIATRSTSAAAVQQRSRCLHSRFVCVSVAASIPLRIIGRRSASL